MSQAVKRSDIAKEARTWVGTRYQHMGRTREGIDCVGLVLKVAEPFGLHTYADDVAYSRESKGQELMQPFKQHMDRISIGRVEPGDVVLFREGPFPQHCGIVVEDAGRLFIVHAEARARRATITALDSMYENAIAAFRFKETV